MKKISIISPVYNESANIVNFIDAVRLVMGQLPYQWEIILVDDGSRDDSWKHMVKSHQAGSDVTSIRLAKNFGKEAAIAAGLSMADGDAVITIDSDLQHPPTLIPEMLKKWEKGAEVVVAVKQERQQEGFIDRIAANCFYRLFQWVTENDIRGSSDFILLDRKVVAALRTLPEKLFFYRGVAHWIGFEQETVLFKPDERQGGVSGWSFWKKIRLAMDSLTGFSAKPLMLIWFMMLVFVFFAVIVITDSLISKIMGHSVSGFATLILVILVTGIAILSSLCLLTVYIRQIFYEVKARPRFIVQDIHKAIDDKEEDKDNPDSGGMTS